MSARWLHQQFFAAADSAPDALALILGERTISYGELATEATQLASALRRRGVGRGDIVALCFEPSIEHIACTLAVMKAGAAWVALDVAWPADRQQVVLTKSAPKMLLCGDDVHGVPFDGVTLFCGDLVKAHGPNDVDVDVDATELAASDLCYVMFTSGSSGIPNGVKVTHGNVAGLLSNIRQQWGFNAGDRWSAMHSAAFGFSLWEVWGALSTGAALAIVPRSERSNPWAWSARARADRVSVLSLTPSGLRQWLSSACEPWAELRTVVLSGEPLTQHDVDACYRQWSMNPPRLLNTYALTETAGRVAVAEVRAGQSAAVLGTVTPDAELLLADAETLRPVIGNGVGELLIGGTVVSAGYLHDDALTAERFVRLDPGDGSERLFYRSGDLARRRSDGGLEFAGRNDAQIKLRGYRIEPADIEAALQSHPQVASAAVVAVGTDGGQRLHAFVVPSTPDRADGSSVELWPSLGEYQVYDALLYDFMSADEIRVAAYQRAFEHHAKGKVVLDIGTGKDALLARLALRAGARHVYAVEVLPEAASAAADLVARLGLQDRITVICGDMDTVELPEPVALCTQGIVGNIGSSDGIVPIWNRARRFFDANCVAVPARCRTFIAPATLPADLRAKPAFGPLAADYARRVFAAEGRTFDVRLCVRNFPREGLIAEPAVFEDLDFAGELATDYEGEARFVVATSGWFDGYVLWTQLDTDKKDYVDFFAHQQAWLPVWFPVGDAPVYLDAGTEVTLRWRCETSAGQVFPDYCIETRIGREDATHVYRSRHHEQDRGSTALHRSLLASLEQDSVALDADNLRSWLAARLPDYMVPAVVDFMPRLPLNSSEKLDRRALLEQAAAAQPAPLSGEGFADPLETGIAALWREVLGVAVGPETDFFAAGGDSISAVRLTTEVQRYLDDAVFLAALFEAPTVSRYCRWLREHHAAAVNRRLGAGEPSQLVQLLEPADRSRAPLSWAQQSLCFLQQLYPENTAANEQFVIRLHNIDPQRLAVAWTALIDRHDVLSARFLHATDARSGQWQLVDESLRKRMRELPDVLDLSASDNPERELRQLATREIAVQFDLTAGRLLRPVLVRVSSRDWSLLVTAHHIVADGLCVPLIRDELFMLYHGETLAAPEVQFGDFSRWQRQHVQGAWLENELAWWREQLSGATLEPVTPILPQPSAAGPEARLPFSIGQAESQALRALAEANGASMFVTLLTVWRVWLARCFDRNDFLIGSPVTQRTTEQTANMLGCLVNNVAFRNALDMQVGFAQILRSEREQVLAALDHSIVPFEKIVEDLQPERVFARHPLFQFMFQFEERVPQRTGRDGAGFGVDVLSVDRASYWDMELALTDAGDDQPLQGFLGVRTDLFEAASVAQWTEGLQALITALCADPHQAISTLPLLSERQRSERARINATSMPVPDRSLFEMFAQMASVSPQSIAVRCGGESHSYHDILTRVLSCAQALVALGVKPGEVVGLHMRRGVDAIVMLLALNRCGAIWLALDPGYPSARIRGMLQAAQPVLVVLEDARYDDVFTGNNIATVIWSALQAYAPEAEAGLPHAITGEQLCVLFTSGSTGEPKGVMLSQRAAVSRCLWMWDKWEFGTAVHEVFGHRTSLNFVDAIWEIFGALIHGAAVDIAPDDAQRDMAAQARWVSRQGITHALAFPSALSLLLEQWVAEPPVQLHTLISTGEALSISALRSVNQALPGCRLINTYGTSENWDITAAALQGRDDEVTVPVGLPVANTRVHVLDRHYRPLPAGVAGRLCVAGYGVDNSYINGAAVSLADRYREDPDDPSGKLFVTGDLGSLRDNGELLLHGRADRQLKLRGVRIEPGEIEAVVNSCSGVRQSAVILRGADAASAWLSLYVLRDNSQDATVDEVELRRVLSGRLPPGAVPADIIFVNDIPLTPSGKIDVRSLTAVSLTTGLADSQRAAAPATETEAALLEIWMSMLGMDRLGIHDNFFAVRGNSLLATRVIARICDRFDVDLPLASIFESPTVAELARMVDAMLWARQGAGGGGADDGAREVVRL